MLQLRHRAYYMIAGLVFAAVGGALWLRLRPLPVAPVLHVGSPSAAELTQAEAAAADGKNAAAQLRLAQGRLRAGQPEAALTPLSKAAHSRETAGPAGLMLADIAEAGTLGAQALPAAQDAVHTNPADSRAWEGLIRVLYRLGRIGPGEAALGEAIRRFPQAPRLRVIEAQTLAARGELRAAVAAYQAALKLRPDAGAETALGMTLAQLDARQEAKEAFQRARELDPATVTPYLGLAKLNLELGLPKEAEEAAYGAIQVAPAEPEALFILARVLAVRAGQEEQRTATELFNKVLADRPSHLEARYHLAVLHLRAGEAKAAARAFELVLQDQPHRLDARQNYAKALGQAGEKAAALEQQRLAGQLAELEQRRYQLTTRVTRSPNDARARLDLAEFYLENGAASLAVREFEHALRLAPDSSEAAAGLERARQGGG
jgi:cytochrome c-type biogenesis protein CcmH/NrfG